MKKPAPEARIMAIASALWFCGWSGIRFLVHRHHRSLIPSCLRATNLVDVRESLWGVGPGGNETGLLVFELPEDSATAVNNGGTGFLKQACSESPASRRRGGRFQKWQQTPMAPEATAREHTGSVDPATSAGPQRIAHVLDQYGSPIVLDQAMETMIDNALAEPGNDYHSRRTSLLIVIPAKRRVVYADAG
jgi:hypothetical protein